MAEVEKPFPLLVRLSWRIPTPLTVVAFVASMGLIAGGFSLYVRATAGCPVLRGNLVLVATNDRLKEIVASSPDCVAPLQASMMLYSDLAIILGYLGVGTITIATGWWRFEAPVLRRILPIVVWLPAVVAALDVMEDVLLFATLDTRAAVPFYDPEYFATIVFMFAWSKWSIALLTVIVGVMSAAVRFSRRADPYSTRGRIWDLSSATVRDDSDLRALDDPPDWADPEIELTKAAGPRPVIGICLSGGGIRSAAFGLGVLSELEAKGSANESVTEQARYVAAVSGGSWAATAWTIKRASESTAHPVAPTLVDTLTSQRGLKGYQPQKFLINGRGGMIGLIAWAVVCSAVNIALVALLIVLIAWPLGFVMRSVSMHPELVAGEHLEALTDGGVLVTIAIAFLIVGAVIVVVCGALSKASAQRWAPRGAAVVGLALFTAAYLTWIPALFTLVAKWPETHGPDSAATATAVGAITTTFVASVATSLWRIISGPITKQVGSLAFRLLPKLFGVLIAAGWLVWALVVMHYAVRGYLFDGVSLFGWHPSASWTWFLSWLAAVVSIIAMYLLLNPNWPTLHNVYARRLAATFDPTNGGGQRWDELAAVSKPEPEARVPELILCCAQQRDGIAPGGLRAESFTISPHWVRQGKRSMPRAHYEEVTRAIGTFKPKISNTFDELVFVAPWLATTGAAFSSAMGRQSLGSANALLATVNADLGIWLPNAIIIQLVWVRRLEAIVRLAPGETWTAATYAQQLMENQSALVAPAESDVPTTTSFVGRTGTAIKKYLETARQPVEARARNAISEETTVSVAERRTHEWRTLLPQPRFAYILKEIVGWYSDHDRYSFVTDGGHWENLGLVELLRRRCDVIYCIDASGDPPGTFATLRQAFELESLELGQLATDLDLDDALGEMLPSSKGLPAAIATSFLVRRAQDATTVTIHYAKLQATQAMSKDLRRFAVADPTFPHYSTARQFLKDAQFRNLVKLGQFAGREVKASAGRLSSDRGKGTSQHR